MDLEFLGEYGIDYQKGIARCMDDRNFYIQVLSMFLQDDSFARAKAAYEAGDRRTLFSCAHELKGACGNAELSELYKAVCPLVELLRFSDGSDEEVATLFAKLEAAYDIAIKGIKILG